MTRHAMIDLETLSTANDAAVISVGVAIFDESSVVFTQGWAIDMEKITGHIDPKTIAWWMHPDRDSARDFSFHGKFDPFTVAYELKALLASHNVQEVWANDPHFDYIILRSWWERTNAKGNVGEFPIPYWAPRSYITLVGEVKRLGHDTSSWKGTYVAHDPIDDAASQARVVIQCRKVLK